MSMFDTYGLCTANKPRFEKGIPIYTHMFRRVFERQPYPCLLLFLCWFGSSKSMSMYTCECVCVFVCRRFGLDQNLFRVVRANLLNLNWQSPILLWRHLFCSSVCLKSYRGLKLNFNIQVNKYFKYNTEICLNQFQEVGAYNLWVFANNSLLVSLSSFPQCYCWQCKFVLTSLRKPKRKHNVKFNPTCFCSNRQVKCTENKIISQKRKISICYRFEKWHCYPYADSLPVNTPVYD